MKITLRGLVAKKKRVTNLRHSNRNETEKRGLFKKMGRESVRQLVISVPRWERDRKIM